MFTDTQLKAREMKLDIVAIAEQQHAKLGKIHHISAKAARKAEKIVDEVDCKGYADSTELTELEITLKHIKRWARV
jgi:hypothetical protein